MCVCVRVHVCECVCARAFIFVKQLLGAVRREQGCLPKALNGVGCRGKMSMH